MGGWRRARATSRSAIFAGRRDGGAGDLAPGSQVLGVPAVERRLWAKVVAAKQRLPELLVRVRRIEKRLGIDGEG
jgi:hypothetical protein